MRARKLNLNYVMKSALWLHVLLLFVVVPPSRGGVVVNLDFTTGYATGNCDVASVGDQDCNRGSSFSIGAAGVVITARTNLGNTPQLPIVIDMAASGDPGIIYWGDLGGIGPYCYTNAMSPGAVCPGLGVRSTASDKYVSTTGTANVQDEIIIFNWSPDQQVLASSIILTLQGFGTGDQVYIYLETASNTNPAGADYAFEWSAVTSGTSLNFGTATFSTPLPTDYITKLGVLERSGDSGIAALTYEAVPEPAAFVLTGVPLLALGFLLRRRARKKQG